MNQKYHYETYTEEYSRKILKEDLHQFIDLCKKYNIKSLNTAFGYAWGDMLHDWKAVSLSPKEIINMVHMAEKKDYGELGSDDLSIISSEYEFQLKYCHHGDIHLEFNTEFFIIEDILNNWEKKGWKLKKYIND